MCRSACLECVLYLSGQEITSFSRHGHWVHKGLWVIGNPDGLAWASRKKRLPQKSKANIRATMLMGLISVCAPLLFFYCSFSLLIFPIIPQLMASSSSSLFSIQLTYEWGWETQDKMYNWLKSWVGRSMGTNQQSMYKRTSQLSWVIFTIHSYTIHPSCPLWGTTSSTVLKRSPERLMEARVTTISLCSLAEMELAVLLQIFR